MHMQFSLFSQIFCTSFEFPALCVSQLAGPNFCNDGHQHLLCCCPYSWSLDFTSSDGTVWWHAYRPDLLAFVRTCWVVESDLEKVYILSFSDGENSYRYFMEKSVHFFQKIAKIGTTELAKFFHSLSETELTRHCQKVWPNRIFGRSLVVRFVPLVIDHNPGYKS